jgi:hypothetical protein
MDEQVDQGEAQHVEREYEDAAVDRLHDEYVGYRGVVDA